MKRLFTFCAWPLVLGPQIISYSGALMNQIAMAANGAVMPVLYAGSSIKMDEDHTWMVPTTHYKILCDWINLHSVVMSPGDVLIYLSDYIQAPLFWAWITYAVFCMVKVFVTPSWSSRPGGRTEIWQNVGAFNNGKVHGASNAAPQSRQPQWFE